MSKEERLDRLEQELGELRGQFAALMAFLCEDEDDQEDAARWHQAHERAKARRKRDRRDS